MEKDLVEIVETSSIDEEFNKPDSSRQKGILEAYLKIIGEIPLLNLEEEQTLARKILVAYAAADLYLNKFKKEIEGNSKKPIAQVCALLLRDLYPRKNKINPKTGKLEKPRTSIKRSTGKMLIENFLSENKELLKNTKYETYLKNAEENYSQGLIAVQEMTRHNLRLVVDIAKGYVGNGLDFIVLIQEGNIGLARASEKFDISKINPKNKKPYKFSTYATWWITQNITRAISKDSTAIRTPVHQVEKLNKMNHTYALLHRDLQRAPNVEEMAKKMNISEKKVRELMCIREMKNITSLESSLSGEAEGTFHDVIADKHTEKPDAANDTNEKLIQIIDDTLILKNKINKDGTIKKEVIALDRDAEIIKLRFGLHPDFYGESKTLEEVGHMFKVVRERVRQIEARALRKLRRRPELKELLDNLHADRD